MAERCRAFGNRASWTNTSVGEDWLKGPVLSFWKEGHALAEFTKTLIDESHPAAKRCYEICSHAALQVHKPFLAYRYLAKCDGTPAMKARVFEAALQLHKGVDFGDSETIRTLLGKRPELIEFGDLHYAQLRSFPPEITKKSSIVVVAALQLPKHNANVEKALRVVVSGTPSVRVDRLLCGVLANNASTFERILSWNILAGSPFQGKFSDRRQQKLADVLLDAEPGVFVLQEVPPQEACSAFKTHRGLEGEGSYKLEWVYINKEHIAIGYHTALWEKFEKPGYVFPLVDTPTGGEKWRRRPAFFLKSCVSGRILVVIAVHLKSAGFIDEIQDLKRTVEWARQKASAMGVDPKNLTMVLTGDFNYAPPSVGRHLAPWDGLFSVEHMKDHPALREDEPTNIYELNAKEVQRSFDNAYLWSSDPALEITAEVMKDVMEPHLSELKRFASKIEDLNGEASSVFDEAGLEDLRSTLVEACKAKLRDLFRSDYSDHLPIMITVSSIAKNVPRLSASDRSLSGGGFGGPSAAFGGDIDVAALTSNASNSSSSSSNTASSSNS